MSKSEAIRYNVKTAWWAAKHHAQVLLGTPFLPTFEAIARERAWTRFCEALYWRQMQREVQP